VNQIILVDDCSPDGTLRFLRAKYGSFENIVISQTVQNGGPSAARNVGLGLATCDYVALLDADDAWAPDRNRNLTKLIRETDPDFLGDNLFLFDGGNEEIIRTGFPESDKTIGITTSSLFLNDIITKGKFNYGLLKPYMRREFLTRNRLIYDETLRYGEDFKLYAEILLCGGRALLSCRAGYIYTTSVGERSGWRSDQSRTIARFDILHRTSRELRRAYADVIDVATDRAIATREKSLLLIHAANVAREHRLRREWTKYVVQVLTRPSLLALLIDRQIKRALRRMRAG